MPVTPTPLLFCIFALCLVFYCIYYSTLRYIIFRIRIFSCVEYAICYFCICDFTLSVLPGGNLLHILMCDAGYSSRNVLFVFGIFAHSSSFVSINWGFFGLCFVLCHSHEGPVRVRDTFVGCVSRGVASAATALRTAGPATSPGPDPSCRPSASCLSRPRPATSARRWCTSPPRRVWPDIGCAKHIPQITVIRMRPENLSKIFVPILKTGIYPIMAGLVE